MYGERAQRPSRGGLRQNPGCLRIGGFRRIRAAADSHRKAGGERESPGAFPVGIFAQHGRDRAARTRQRRRGKVRAAGPIGKNILHEVRQIGSEHAPRPTAGILLKRRAIALCHTQNNNGAAALAVGRLQSAPRQRGIGLRKRHQLQRLLQPLFQRKPGRPRFGQPEKRKRAVDVVAADAGGHSGRGRKRALLKRCPGGQRAAVFPVRRLGYIRTGDVEQHGRRRIPARERRKVYERQERRSRRSARHRLPAAGGGEVRQNFAGRRIDHRQCEIRGQAAAGRRPQKRGHVARFSFKGGQGAGGILRRGEHVLRGAQQLQLEIQIHRRQDPDPGPGQFLLREAAAQPFEDQLEK